MNSFNANSMHTGFINSQGNSTSSSYSCLNQQQAGSGSFNHSNSNISLDSANSRGNGFNHQTQPSQMQINLIPDADSDLYRDSSSATATSALANDNNNMSGQQQYNNQQAEQDEQEQHEQYQNFGPGGHLEVVEQKQLSKEAQFSVLENRQKLKDGPSPIYVLIRVRPLNKRELGMAPKGKRVGGGFMLNQNRQQNERKLDSWQLHGHEENCSGAHPTQHGVNMYSYTYGAGHGLGGHGHHSDQVHWWDHQNPFGGSPRGCDAYSQMQFGGNQQGQQISKSQQDVEKFVKNKVCLNMLSKSAKSNKLNASSQSDLLLLDDYQKIISYQDPQSVNSLKFEEFDCVVDCYGDWVKWVGQQFEAKREWQEKWLQNGTQQEPITQQAMLNQCLWSSCIKPKVRNQTLIYENVGRKMLDWALEGRNWLVFWYGQTSTGKTTTMFGSFDKDNISPKWIGNANGNGIGSGLGSSGTQFFQNQWQREQSGVVVRTLYELFNYINSAGSPNIRAKLSYMELYNEQLFDLNAGFNAPGGRQGQNGNNINGNRPTAGRPGIRTGRTTVQPKTIGRTTNWGPNTYWNWSWTPLPVRQHPDIGVYIPGLTQSYVRTYDEWMQLVEYGNKLKTV